MTLALRYMRLKDVSQVVNIDRESFPTPWSIHSYNYEIAESTYSHMNVLEAPIEQPVQGLRKLVRTISRQGAQTQIVQQIVAYGGLWNIAGEAHISTIASHPQFRGNGWGEISLAGMIKKAICLQAEYIVLEVRVSNKVAQNLYEKYEFETVDIKRNYYRDDNEDAYDMRLDLENHDLIQRFHNRYEALQATRKFDDSYSDNPCPTR